MDRKAQVGIGLFVSLFITIIVGAILLQAVAQSAAVVAQTGYSNGTNAGGQQVTPGSQGAIVCLTGQEFLGTTAPTAGTGVVINATAEYLAPNYTITEGVCPTTGVKSVLYTQVSNNGTTLTYNVSYDYGVDGYADNSGARGVTTMIIIFMALAILVVVLVPVLQSDVIKGALGK